MAYNSINVAINTYLGGNSMCTAATFSTDNNIYFGRNLDYERSYGESVTVTPRNYSLHLRHAGCFSTGYAIIGMAHVCDGYPLYYDAMNEAGLYMAGLNFVGNAVYSSPEEGKDNIAQFELLLWILGQCAGISDVRNLLARTNIVSTAFSDKLPCAQLHWMIGAKDGCIVLEQTLDGMHIYDNPVGVLTNNPPFPMQMFSLNNYRGLSAGSVVSSFAPGLELKTYSRGMAAIGLPGDLSSQSRFVKAAFVRNNCVADKEDTDGLCQLFHILNSVEQQKGCCRLDSGEYEYTIYTGCCDAGRGIYYYTTYESSTPIAVDMHREDLNGKKIVSYPLDSSPYCRFIN